MRFFIAFLLSLICSLAYAQPYSIRGKILDERDDSAVVAAIDVTQKNLLKKSGNSGKDGLFRLNDVLPGKYTLTIASPGFAAYRREVAVTDSNIDLGVIRLQPISQTLDEVKIVQQALAMVQKDDTMEYNSGAYKMNPDADAADLVRKMPGIELNGKEVKAQGQAVLKILVDGKPFFGEDAYATLKNLPADVIDKVQVYNEKSDQERFTGFSEGPQNKAINIVTKPNRRKGVFGNVYAGGGADNSINQGDFNGIYGTGLALNRFGGDRRMTVTAQSNNINAQNFTEQGVTTGSSGGGGITTSNAVGINYSDKWGKKVDVNGSYFYSKTDNYIQRQIHRAYVLPSAAGQVYDEASPSESHNTNQRIYARISYSPDSMNTILLQPGLNAGLVGGVTEREGTTVTATNPLNTTFNHNTNSRPSVAFSNNALYTHKFQKKGRTFSAGISTGYNDGRTTTTQYARNEYFADTALNDTLNQRIMQWQQSWNTNANATFTEPMGQKGLIKLQYHITYLPSVSVKEAYNYVNYDYSQPDSQLSNSFISGNTAHKAGGSYLHKESKYEYSIGAYYQATVLDNQQRLPVEIGLNRTFSNLLPTATLQYRFSKTSNLQCFYNTNTHAPSITQLQNVVSNADPLHLSTGNPSLKQPYSHSLSVRYSTSGKKVQSNLSASLTGGYTQNNISTTSFVAVTDTLIGQVRVPSGGQLTMPVNIDGSATLNGNASYGMPVKAIKCRVNINLNAALNRSPSIINNVVNYQQNKNLGAGLAINSSISESVDFSLSSNTTVSASDNPVNKLSNTTFVSESCRASVNIILWKLLVINSAATYQANFGLSAGYNRNYLLWNMAIGKKLFKKRQGDIRFSVFDMLNENNNVQRSITDTYIQDTRTNILQRYYMLVFTYKINKFGK